MATVLKSDPYSVMNELAVCISLDPERVKNGMLMVVQASKDSSAEGGEAAKGGVAEKVGRTTEIDRDKMIVSVVYDDLCKYVLVTCKAHDSTYTSCDSHMEVM